MLPNLGISTSYFAARGFSIYDSVKRVHGLGFRLIELGANHNPEEKIWDILAKIRQDFSETTFTQHCNFPPLYTDHLVNAAEGLSKKNKKTIEAMIKAARILNSKVLSFHTGFNSEFTFKGVYKDFAGFKEFVPTKNIPSQKAMTGLKSFIRFFLEKALDSNVSVAIENVTSLYCGPSTLTTFDDFKNILLEFPGLNFLFDYGHGFIMHGQKADEFFSLDEKIAAKCTLTMLQEKNTTTGS